MERGRRFWLPLVMLALGGASIGLLVATDRIRERLLVPAEAAVRAVGQIQTRLSTAHLWVEEYVTGDEVELEQVRRDEGEALELAAALVGRGAARAAPGLEPFTDPELQRRGSLILEEADAFRRMTEERVARYQGGEDVGVATPADAVFDAAFYDLLTDLQALDAILLARLGRAHQRSEWLLRAFLLAWGAIVLLAVLGLWTRARRQRQAELALRSSRDQLLQAQRLESIGQLAGGVAHDLNNYLAAISAQCEVLRMTPEPAERVRQKMDAVIQTTGRAAQLTQQMLAFSRRQPLRARVVSLNAIVSGLTPMMERLLGARVELASDLDPAAGNVRIDPSQLEQVIVNLLINARDAMPDGGRVRLTTRRLHAPVGRQGAGTSRRGGDRVELVVQDSGTGIAPEVCGRLFEPFVTTKGHSNHSGLGLATVHGIVKQSGGEIEVESEPDLGAAFRITLPWSPEAAESVDAAAAAEPAGGAARRILVAEDNPDVRASIEEMLRRLGHSVTAAASGREAVALYELDPSAIDLLITDLIMPGMSGRDLVRTLRERRPDLPFLYVSAFPGDTLPSGSRAISCSSGSKRRSGDEQTRTALFRVGVRQPSAEAKPSRRRQMAPAWQPAQVVGSGRKRTKASPSPVVSRS